MLNSTSKTFCISAVCIVQLVGATYAQEDWPHSSVDWSDPLFQARVQGVYDWIGSGPDQLLAETEAAEYAVPVYELGTANRDLETFPPRQGVRFEGQLYDAPKGWTDRLRLIRYMEDNEEIEPDFFEDALDERAGADSYFLLANIYFLQERFEEAIEYYELAIEDFPLFKLANKNLAYAYLQLGDCESALAHAGEAISLGALGVQIKKLQAFCAFEAGEFSVSAEAAAVALTLDPASEIMLRIQIRSLAALGSFESAVTLSNQLSDEKERVSLALDIQLAEARQQASESEMLALLEIKSRLEGLEGEEATTLTQLKLRYGFFRRIELDSLTNYLRSEHVAATEIESLLQTYLNAGQISPEQFESVAELIDLPESSISTTDNEILFRLAELESEYGSPDEAESLLERALQDQPIQCESLLLMSELLQNSGDTIASESYSSRASASSRSCDNVSLERRAMLSVAKGSYSEAQNLLLRDWNQKLAIGEIPDEMYVRKFRAITNLGNLTSE